MRTFLLLAIAGGLISVGCSHKAKNPDHETAPPAATAEKKMDHTAKAAPGEMAKGASKSDCSVKGDERVVEVRSKEKGCELAYTKAGKENVVASSAFGMGYCEKAAEKLKEKLKGSGYACK